MNLLKSNQIIQQCDKLFKCAANAWVRGNNSGNGATLEKMEKLCEKLRGEAEKILEPLGIAVDYPGLYPSFRVAGHVYHSTESAVSAALESGNRITILFKDKEDARAFRNYRVAAIATEGTVTGVKCGLMCSALKRSTI